MIFLTVGTYHLPFERLTRLIDSAIGNGLINEEVIAQIGMCEYKPKNMKYFPLLTKEKFDFYFQQATSLISHAGMGSITMAIEQKKPMLVMPRLKEHNEIVNDHQLHTAQKFEKLGHVLAIYNENEISEKIQQLKYFKPKERIAQPQKVADRIADFLNSL